MKKRIKICIALLLLLMVTESKQVFAQLSAVHDFNRCDSIILIGEYGDTLAYPFAGGLNSCQFANIDLNLDGIEDLLVFDRHGNRLLPFVTELSVPRKFHFSPGLSTFFPPLEHWMQAIDYDFDGRKDIFTYTTGGIKVYRNESVNELRFRQVTSPFLLSQQGTTLTNILVTYADYPAIADVDADGDMDLLTFWGLGSFVEWHRNTSMERFGSADSLTFEKSSSCWGHFAEGNEDNTIILDTCAGTDSHSKSSIGSSGESKHTGSTMLLHDLNGDGLPDLTIGDVDFSSLIHLANGGTLPDAAIISQTTLFPNAVDPVLMPAFPAAMLVDVDNDGLKDMVVSPFDPSLTKGENFRSILLYQNAGSAVLPDYQKVTDNFLQDQMLDLGSGAYPVFFDYNGDGLMDMLVGNYGYTDTCIYTTAAGLQCTYVSKIALLQNEGTPTHPVFRLIDRNIAHLDTLAMQSLIPAIADLDGDGDSDLLCGNSKGKLVYCENTAQPGLPADFRLSDPAWHSIDVGDFSAPQLFDIDEDGFTDLLCGKKNGTISFYKNAGTIAAPAFTLVTESFGGVDVTNSQLSNSGYCVPQFFRGKQGETILFTGSEFGDVFVYDQIDGNLEGNFRLLGGIPGVKAGWRSSVAVGNLNNDTLADMFSGNYSGGLGLFFGKPDKLFGTGVQPGNTIPVLTISPNPAVDQVVISIDSDRVSKPKSLVIQSMDGRILEQFSGISLPFVMNLSRFPNGIYLVSIHTALGVASGKLVICR